MAIVVFGGVYIVQVCNIYFIDNIPSEVYVDQKLVYKGISAGFSSDSQGYATKVVIKGGWLYLFPQKVYVSKDVVIKGEK